MGNSSWKAPVLLEPGTNHLTDGYSVFGPEGGVVAGFGRIYVIPKSTQKENGQRSSMPTVFCKTRTVLSFDYSSQVRDPRLS